MKILAIRGANLASLAEPFDISFEKPPLADVGLFAITGRTGSGKSTVLDALCLALYDRVPRTSQVQQRQGSSAKTPSTGEDKTDGMAKPHDTRTLLRSGAGEGYAEVDFMGRDRKKYRARWQVRRARKRSAGKLQEVQMSLEDLSLDCRPIGGKKRETLQAIQQRVGLAFEQFSRTVLLSQGEFDAFLKANENERGILLEALTGTDLYSCLSRQVFQRARETRATLNRTEAQLGENTPLSPDARNRAEEEAEGCRVQRDAARALLARMERDLAWFHRQEARGIQRRQAQEVLDAVRDREARSQSERDLLIQIQKAHALRPEQEALIQAQDDLFHLQDRWRRHLTEMAAAHHRLAAVEEERRSTTAALAQVRTDYGQLAPSLEKTAVLEARIEAARITLAQHDRQADRDARHLTRLQEEAQHFLAQKAHLLQSERENRQWLEENGRLACLEGRLEEIENDIRHAQQISQRRSQGRQRQEASLREGERYQLEIVRWLGEIEQWKSTLYAEQSALRTLTEKWADAPSLSTRQGQQQKIDQQNRVTARLLESHQQVLAAEEARETHQKQLDLLTQERARCGAANEVVSRDLERIILQGEEAERACRLAQIAAGKEAEKWRALLEEGTPCPVCGAIDHPAVREQDGFWQAPLQAQKARVQQLRDQEKRLRTQREACIRKISEQETAQAYHQQGVQQAVSSREAAAAAWRGHREKGENIGIVWPCESTDVPRKGDLARLIEHRDRWLQRQRDLERQILERSTEQEAQQRHQQALRDHQMALTEREKALIRAQAGREAARQAAQAAQQTLVDLEQRLDERIRRLLAHRLPMLSRPELILERPEEIIAECRQAHKVWCERQEAFRKAREALEQQEMAQQSRKEQRLIAQENQQRSQAQQQKSRDSLDQQCAEHWALWHGESSQTVKSRWEERLRQAEAVQKAAVQRQAWVRADLAHLLGQQEQLKQQCQGAVEKARKDQDRLAERCRQLGLAAEKLAAGLDVSEGEWLARQQKLRLLFQEVEQKEAHLALLCRQQRQEEREALPPLDRLTLSRLMKKQEKACDHWETQYGVAMGVLHGDDQRKQRAAALLSRWESEQETVALWERMNALIGSQNGSKFRTFAQSLTLNRLVVAANGHLAALTPRYRLQRAGEGHLSLQVIDLEMGFEPRGMANLSGGERFLASLALSLGLADMSSNRGILVESLFIDEGFGALDEASLDVAISALEALQATGRVVGVISHVTALNERIGVQIRVQSLGGGRSCLRLRP